MNDKYFNNASRTFVFNKILVIVNALSPQHKYKIYGSILNSVSILKYLD